MKKDFEKIKKEADEVDYILKTRKIQNKMFDSLDLSHQEALNYQKFIFNKNLKYKNYKTTIKSFSDLLDFYLLYKNDFRQEITTVKLLLIYLIDNYRSFQDVFKLNDLNDAFEDEVKKYSLPVEDKKKKENK